MLERFINVVKKDYSTHPNYAIAMRVLACCIYIRENGSVIGKAVEMRNLGSAKMDDDVRKGVVRAPNGMSFHVNGYQTANEARKGFTQVIENVEGTLHWLLEQNDPALIKSFLSKIKDTETGCMEWRLSAALNFVGLMKSSRGIQDFNDLLMAFHNECSEKGMIEETAILREALSYFQDKVNNEIPVLVNGEMQTLTWEMVVTGLKDTLELDDWLSVESQIIQPTVSYQDKQDWYLLYFREERDAELFLSYLRVLLREKFGTELSLTTIWYEPQKDFPRFRLTKAQYQTCQALIQLNKGKEKRNEKGESSDSIDHLPNEITHREALKDCRAIKTIRADQDCFIYDFSEGVTRTPKTWDPTMLRPKSRQRFTVFGGGVVERGKKTSLYPAEEKAYYSRYQSVSLIQRKKIEGKVFNWKQEQAPKLVGVEMPVGLIGRMMVYDVGTYTRPYDHKTYEQALQHFVNKTDETHRFYYQDAEAFLNRLNILQFSGDYNEVLMRLKWDETCLVCICADNLAARLLAQEYARILRRAMRRRAKELKQKLDESHTIQIIYYLPTQKKHRQVYTAKEQAADLKEAQHLYQDEKSRRQQYEQKNYEWLLAFPDSGVVISEQLPIGPPIGWFKQVQPRKSLLLQIIQDGYVHIARMLMEKDSQQVYKKLPVSASQINELDKKGNTALYYAVASGADDIVSWLLQRGARVDFIYEREGKNITHIAVQYSRLSTLILLQNLQTNLELKDKTGKTILHQAIKERQAEIVKYLIDKGSNINGGTLNGWNPLHLAVEWGNLAVVTYLIQHGANSMIEAENKDGCTPLHSAALHGHLAVVAYLIQHGAKIEAKDKDNWTPLHLAIGQGHLAIATYLIENSAKIEAENKDGWTALHVTAQQGYLTVMAYLIKNGAKIEAKNRNDLTPLHIAASCGHLEIVKYLIEHGAQIEAKTKNGLTPLQFATQQGHLEIVTYLIEHGAQIEAKNNDGLTPLHVAAQQGHLEIVAYLIEHGAQIEAENNDGLTPLHVAAQQGHLEIVTYLIEHGAQIEAKNNDGLTPLHVAAQQGHLEIVTYLIEHGAQIEAKNNDGWTPLHVAAQQGHLEIVAYLIEHGAQIEAENNDDLTPLHLASKQGHLEIVKYLIKHGAKIEAKNNDGWTPLHLTAHNGHLEIVKYLIEIEHGAKIEEENNDGWTALHLAAKQGHLTVMAYLIKNGAKIEIKNKNDWTPLHFAATWGHFAAVISLIENGADIEAKENDGWTSLHLAAQHGHLEIVKYLIEHGAQIEAENNDGLTPLKLATQYGHLEIVKYLIEHGAQIEAENNDRLTPLQLAAQYGHLEIISYLIKSGADINKKTQKGQTALDLAFLNNDNTNVMKYLLDQGASKNITIKYEWKVAQIRKLHSLLWNSVSKGEKKMVEYLIAAGADMNAQDQDGSTSLHLAAKKGHLEVVKYLVENNAKIDALDKNGRTALDLAICDRKDDVANYLLNQRVNTYKL